MRKMVLAATLMLIGAVPAPSGPTLSTALPATLSQGLQVSDPTGQGYVAEEYFLSGTADVLEPVSMADAPDFHGRDNSADQRAQASYARHVTAAAKPYVTRLTVYRPKDARRFSGRVVMETVHPSGGGRTIVWNSINAFLMRDGDAYVAVQHPTTFAGLRAAAPDRYGRLQAAALSQVWGMIADAGRLLKTSGIRGLKARKLFLTGYSFTGVATATFANYHHDATRLANGRPVFDGYFPMANAMYVHPLDVPVMRLTTNSDFRFYGALDNRRQDGPRYRLYELPGAAHVTTPWPETGAAKPARDVKVAEGPGLPSFTPQQCYDAFPKGSRPNDYPTRLAQEALFKALFDWSDRGIAPPPGTRIATDATGHALTDANGNAVGGLRLTPIAVPAATYAMGDGEQCFLYGYTLPFGPAKMQALYGGKAGYVAAVARSAQGLVKRRLLLPEGAAELIAAAKR